MNIEDYSYRVIARLWTPGLYGDVAHHDVKIWAAELFNEDGVNKSLLDGVWYDFVIARGTCKVFTSTVREKGIPEFEQLVKNVERKVQVLSSIRRMT